MKIKYYHGTSTSNNIRNKILPPVESGNIREDFRTYNRDLVYLTDSFSQALKYAVKACDTFGGDPIVFECIPKYWVAERRPHEFVTPLAICRRK